MSIKSLIREEKFFHHFQPIYDLVNWRRFGYEALLRTKEFQNPEETFIAAKKQKQLYELDIRSIHKAVLTYRSAGFSRKDGYLFINIYPSTILNPSFPTFLNQIISNDSLKSQQIVLEISESEVINEFTILQEHILILKNEGFLIAIDDVGRGYSDFRTIIDLEPDIIKLDRYLANDLHKSKQKQSLVKLLLKYAEQNNSNIILEGIENESEMAMAKALGIKFGQGYVLGRPDALQRTVLTNV
jgi:EAL domain-containing protein (putative c-di-GMP-specific phosphodiesterase class I)